MREKAEEVGTKACIIHDETPVGPPVVFHQYESENQETCQYCFLYIKYGTT
jgi:hypothetical protein